MSSSPAAGSRVQVAGSVSIHLKSQPKIGSKQEARRSTGFASLLGDRRLSSPPRPEVRAAVRPLADVLASATGVAEPGAHRLGRREGSERTRADDLDKGTESEGRAPFEVPLDPMSRALATSVPLGATRPVEIAPGEAVDRASRISLEQVLSRFVRRVAWSGDALAGSARIEIGSGALEGATLTIHADRGAVRVALALPPGVDAAEWRARIARRLDRRGLQLAELEVD